MPRTRHPPLEDRIRLTLQRALLGALVLAILVGTVPAGMALQARLTSTLLDNAQRDLALAPRVLQDRTATMSDALMMRARDLARDSALTEAMVRGDRAGTVQALAPQAAAVPNATPVVVGPDARTWSGPSPSRALVDETRAGRMPVATLTDSSGMRVFSLAAVEREGRWLGAAGFAIGMDVDAARVLAGLTRSDVVLIDGATGLSAATTLDTMRARVVARAVAPNADRYRVPREMTFGDDRLLVIVAPLGREAQVAFVRVIAHELAIVPSLRRLALTAGILSLAAALLLGGWLTSQVTKPVRRLAYAAHAFATGDRDVALPSSRLSDIAVVSHAFGEMRTALAARLRDLQSANQSLSDHSDRLVALQGDLMRRERLDASAHMVAELAHEVRNPIASLRNLLELMRRRASNDPEAVEYADLAIDELLRMHELAERMLDLNRPSSRPVAPGDVTHIATEVARLATLGGGRGHVAVSGAAGIVADIGSDTLRQVLVNLVRNAREALDAMPQGAGAGQVTIDVAQRDGRVHITVCDDGPGIAPDVLPRVFDPFVTTKQSVHGVGLGLYVAESGVRVAGGTISARNDPAGGAVFAIELPVAVQLTEGSP